MRTRHAHPLRQALAPDWRARLGQLAGWKSAGVLALLCSTVAWASLPPIGDVRSDEQRQWQALGIAPLASGGATGMAMAPTPAVETIDFAPKRIATVPLPQSAPAKAEAPVGAGPRRIRGRVGEGLYWSLRAAGASPQVAAEYLAALATAIDVGEVAPNASFDMVLGPKREMLYAGLSRAGEPPLQLVRWTAAGRSRWVDAADAAKPAPVADGMAWPVAGRITSYFGSRYHPILHFRRFHAGLDFGASWGSPIVAAADGQVVRAGWAGGYGRQVRIAHGGGLITSYSHMSEIAAAPGSFVRRGQLIGYVGSSGLSTGPHLHYEVLRSGAPVNPLDVRFASAPVVDSQLANAVKARLKALLSMGGTQG